MFIPFVYGWWRSLAPEVCLSSIDVRHLRHALALAEHRNFGRAADRLGISQPTLSRSIQSLEADLGAPLFDRLPRDVVPTSLGEVLLRRARAIVDATEELEEELAAVLGVQTGELRVAAGPYVSAVLIGPALARLLERHPGIRVDLIEVDSDRMAEVLRAGEVSVVVGERSAFGEDPAFELEPLRVRCGEFICRSGHPLLETPPRTLAELLRWPLATTRIEAAAWRRIARGAPEADEPGGLAESAWTVRIQNLAAISRLIAASDAIGIFSRDMIRRELADGTLAVVPFAGTKPTSDWSLAWRRDRTPSPAALAFLQAVRDADEEVPLD
jgi:DNA-binding transcriptional LysR family regulator